MLTDLTGFTPWAVQVRDGMALAAQEINEAGGVDGRMIEIVTQDSENNAEVGVDRFEQLVEEGVVAVGGIISSAVGAGRSGGRAGADARVPGEVRYAGRLLAPADTPSEPVCRPRQWSLRRCSNTHRNRGSPRSEPSWLTTWGQAFKAMEGAFEGSGIDYTIEVAPVPPDTDFTPFVRAMSDFGA